MMGVASGWCGGKTDSTCFLSDWRFFAANGYEATLVD
jgi:hypothetical protein